MRNNTYYKNKSYKSDKIYNTKRESFTRKLFNAKGQLNARFKITYIYKNRKKWTIKWGKATDNNVKAHFNAMIDTARYNALSKLFNKLGIKTTHEDNSTNFDRLKDVNYELKDYYVIYYTFPTKKESFIRGHTPRYKIKTVIQRGKKYNITYKNTAYDKNKERYVIETKIPYTSFKENWERISVVNKSELI
jgi:hypothetical protein